MAPREENVCTSNANPSLANANLTQGASMSKLLTLNRERQQKCRNG
ncbi:hypothetical protein OOU_Y34scaffold00150g5 [Pyricularia oryzae Y34]|uniref:Uncharacterized protein n=3 Tax=Pyricularia oryzae TaxID=318829 RepID=Q2KFP2_PYRO7|nr:hypothetical protein MGCH7_ch7g643 [Pyricularia oryzae 70-15]ELQ43458.1 hypothetical protein OOU_Y34scaffold00150g5 [Pyricularia oryzae Y34]